VIQGRRTIGWCVLGATLVAVLALRMLVGGAGFGWPDDSVLGYRTSAVLGAASVGAALAMAGLFLQVLLRNPLASPFVLGLSSGAGFGYMLALYLGYVGAQLGWSLGSSVDGTALPGMAGGLLRDVGAPVLAATIGSCLTLAIVWRLGSRGGTADPLALVLAGVVLSAIAGAATTALQSLVPAGLRGDFLAWMMGRIPEAPPPALLGFVVVAAIAATVLGVLLGRTLDAANLSDDEAASVGVSLPRLRATLFVASGVLAAATVALAGPIAFVGLIAPHAARILLGPAHRPLALGSAIAGAALLVAADVVRQTIDLGGGRLPVGVVTAIVGGPIFLVLLRRGPLASTTSGGWDGGGR
jgi:iron complex transport system permease protein